MTNAAEWSIKKSEILIEALPYIQKFYGKTIVIKYGGNAMPNGDINNSVLEDITLLKYVGMNPVVVHGGGPEITDTLGKLNIKSEFINGLRVTDSATMDVVQMVLVGKVNKHIVSNLNQHGVKAIGFCGIDGNLIECEKLVQKIDGKDIDLGYVGKVTKINPKMIEMASQSEYIPVIAPVGIGPDGKSYNINADTVAGEIAGALGAEKLIFLTDVQGIKATSNSEKVSPYITVKEIYQLIDKKIISGGMIPKVLACVDAINKGVHATHIIDGRIPHCVLLEIFTYKGIGTMITNQNEQA